MTREPAIEVTFTTEPLAAFNSSTSPRASMIGAKKLTWNTCCQHDVGLVRQARAAVRLVVAALLTSACNWPSGSLRLISSIARRVGGIAEIDLVWSSGRRRISGSGARAGDDAPAGGRNASVAWPIPRLAPVNSNVRRAVIETGVFLRSATRSKNQLTGRAASDPSFIRVGARTQRGHAAGTGSRQNSIASGVLKARPGAVLEWFPADGW
jgi:hypothetical protein